MATTTRVKVRGRPETPSIGMDIRVSMMTAFTDGGGFVAKA